MNILVTGGTGFIGTRLCRELVENGHEVTALSRTPGDADISAGVETAIGDVTARDSLDHAFEGQDVVINLVSLSPLFKPTGPKTHEEVLVGGARNVVDAAEEHGLRKIVQMSGLGASPGAPTAFLQARGRAEEVVQASNLEWTIFRPSVVFGDGGEFVSFTKMLTTPYITGLPGGGSTRFQPIWVEDLVPMLADCVEAEHDGEIYEIGGPEVLTLADVTRLAYRAEGKSVRILPIPMVLARVGLTLAGAIPFIPMGADQYRSLGIDNTVTDNDASAFGVDPAKFRTLGEYLGL